MKTVMDKDTIYIPEQFELASDYGYLRRHEELSKKFLGLFERADANETSGHAEGILERRKDDLFHQACEDIARQLLLQDEAITSIPTADAQAMVEARYAEFLERPELAGISRASAVH